MKWKKMNENTAAGSYSKDTYINFFFLRNNMQNNLWKLYKNQEKQILNIFIKKISRKEIQQHFHWVSIKKNQTIVTCPWKLYGILCKFVDMKCQVAATEHRIFPELRENTKK